MKTLVLDAGDPASIEQAASILLGGGLVAYPTDTLYGLGAHAFQPAAIAKVFLAKDRPPDRALPLLLSNADQLPLLARDIPIGAWRLARVFWPGALTMVLLKSDRVPPIVTAAGDSVAVRVPNHTVTLSLLRAVDAPIAGTSANLSGAGSPRTAEETLAQLRGRIDAVLDGGPCPGGVESTVLDLTGPRPRLLRAGAVECQALEDVLESAIES